MIRFIERCVDYMKKFFFVFLFIIMIINISLPVNAQKTGKKVGEGYTKDGVYYEVFVAKDVEDNDSVLSSTSISVTREVIYAGIVVPETSISWEEKIDGKYYIGSLKLSSYIYTDGKTVSIYKGILFLKDS